MHIILSSQAQPGITLSPQVLLGILIAVLVIGFLWAIVVGIKRRVGQPRRARRTPWRSSRAGGHAVKMDHRLDHGAHIARKHGMERSPEWPRVAHEHLAIEPACACCGHKGQGLQVHHIKPFHLHPNLELDPNNLITLCEIKGRDHHLLLGHLDDWESYNPNVRADVKRFHKKSDAEIRANPTWQKEMQHRPMA